MDPSVYPVPELALSLVSLGMRGDSRERLARSVEFASSLGVRAVQLDGSAQGVRPRTLDRSSRRDVASIVRRAGLGVSGIDLWIPPEHFVDDARCDLAIASAVEAVRFAGELGALAPFGTGGADPVVSLALGQDARAMGVRRLLAEEAEASGVLVADHGWPPVEIGDWSHGRFGIGIDPAAIQLSGEALSAPRAMAKHARSVVSARLSDTDGASRVVAGEGRLDVFEYVATYVTCGVGTPMVVDVRDVDSPSSAAARIIRSVRNEPTV